MKKVMLVEDEEFILEGLKSIIDWEELGITITHMAGDGEQAFSLWEREPVDIVVTDVNMPGKDGLALIKAVRERDERVRFIILTGYDEFEYARTAMRLDVDHYILKPIDEEELSQAVRDASKKLDLLDQKRIAYIDEKKLLISFLEEKSAGGGVFPDRLAFAVRQGAYAYPAVVSIDLDSLRGMKLADIIFSMNEKGEDYEIRVFPLDTEDLLLILSCGARDDSRAKELFSSLQNRMESVCGLLTFISVGPPCGDVRELPACYQAAVRLKKYRMIDGFGSCVDEAHIHCRSSRDIEIDASVFNKLILMKDKQGALDYMEDLFINNVREDTSADSLYRMSLKIALLLQDIKREYKLSGREGLLDLTDIIEDIYRAKNLSTLKALFNGEIIGIIDYLHTEDSQYTPVVRQIMAEVRESYQEDMNLKTLAYKYHMNTSYLGQIFQKEVGCSFSQYLSSIKNSKAKELILNTNMKINDIARAVGYPETSYFYRKFKQCYGVSPASLREMKKY